MGTIIIPALIVAVVGLIFGIILTIASKLMVVPVDEKIAAIREVLPGANCGGCGFAGCDDYANAFGDDPNLSPTLCPVGGAELATQIASIMRYGQISVLNCGFCFISVLCILICTVMSIKASCLKI